MPRSTRCTGSRGRGLRTPPPRPRPSSAPPSPTHMLAELEAHLDEEERDVVPLIAAHLTKAEWAQVGKKAFDKFTPAQRFIAMGQMLEVARPAEAAAMTAT